MAKRIIMAVTNDLLTDQRVDRSCRALQEAGYEVTLVGRKLPTSEALEARNYRCVRMRLMFRRSAAFYAEYNLRLLIRLLVMPADAFYANDSDTLLACRLAAGLRRKKLFFDAHELGGGGRILSSLRYEDDGGAQPAYECLFCSQNTLKRYKK